MKKAISIVITCVIVQAAFCQIIKIDSALNFGFEKITGNNPTGWDKMGSYDYSIYLDSAVVRSGKYAAVIEYHKEDINFRAWSLTLPGNYAGKEITLSGYIKTENVTDAYAGLWMRIDPGITFGDMEKKGIKGTTDWTKYEITLPLTPSKTTGIVIGALLAGKGKMWIDDLSVTIDGKDISKAGAYMRPILPAEKDTLFNSGSAIRLPALDQSLVENLDLLGKLWGFLKYHHPQIGKGNYNWDYELFRMLPGYVKAKNRNDRDRLLLAWIKKYGPIPACTTCKEAPADAFIKPSLSWIDSSGISSTPLKNMLREIYKNRHQGDHYYIAIDPDISNPIFQHENPYKNMAYPDAGFRLLSLYRYWTMIRYFFPNTYMTDKNWNSVLEEFIPLFISAKTQLDYELAVLQLIGAIDDSHAYLETKKIWELRGRMFSPFRVQFIEKKLVVTDYFNPELKKAAGMEIGDIITHINGRPVEVITDSLKKYYPASNEALRLSSYELDLLRSPNRSVSIEYISSGQKKQKELQLYRRDSLNIYYWYKINRKEKCYKFLNDSIGYITLASIKDEDIPVIKELFKNTAGIIIDIRNYPGTRVAYDLGSYFVSSPTPFVKFTMGNINNPGEFTFRGTDDIPASAHPYTGKLVVLVNEVTQSRAEFSAMAFRAGRNTTIVGSTTSGADGNVSEISLPGGLTTRISGIGVYYPNGEATQRVGIIPDVRIEPTINGIKNGRDELIEKAIEIINAH